jgi:hypothetical protein
MALVSGLEWSGDLLKLRRTGHGLDGWIGVVTAATGDVRECTPINYKLTDSFRDLLQAGSGSAMCACLLFHSVSPNIRFLPFLACHQRVLSMRHLRLQQYYALILR